jgi:high-affinity Fe2+/Pb2+ permease
MTTRSIVLVWLGLLIVVGLQFVLAHYAVSRPIVPFTGIAMAVIVALTFMRLGASKGLIPIFALAGVFWILVLFGLGGLDPFTRHDLTPGSGATRSDQAKS